MNRFAHTMALIAPVVAAATATAQTSQATPGSTANNAGGLEEVVVTATRRSERLMDVPLSVTAFSQAELTQKGIVGFEGIARETPGAVLERGQRQQRAAHRSRHLDERLGCGPADHHHHLSRRAAVEHDRQHGDAQSQSVRHRACRVPARSAGHAVRIGFAVGRAAHPDAQSRISRTTTRPRSSTSAARRMAAARASVTTAW